MRVSHDTLSTLRRILREHTKPMSQRPTWTPRHGRMMMMPHHVPSTAPASTGSGGVQWSGSYEVPMQRNPLVLDAWNAGSYAVGQSAVSTQGAKWSFTLYAPTR